MKYFAYLYTVNKDGLADRTGEYTPSRPYIKIKTKSIKPHNIVCYGA